MARTFGPAPMMQAIQYFRQAIAADPGYALAWSTMASTMLGALLNVPELRQRWLKELDEAVTQAVALAPEAWSTLQACSVQCVSRLDWIGAENANEKAIRAAPSSEAGPLQQRMMILWMTGRLREACDCLPELIRRDPMSLYVSTLAAMLLQVAGRFDAAEAEYERSRDFEGDHALADFWSFLRALTPPGLPAEVQPRFERFLRSESLPMAVHQELRHVLQDTKAAIALVARASRQPEYQDTTRTDVLGLWAAALGDLELAFVNRRSAIIDYQGRSSMTTLWQEALSPLRNQPRFKALLREAGLVDYWRRSGHWADIVRSMGEDDFECSQ